MVSGLDYSYGVAGVNDVLLNNVLSRMAFVLPTVAAEDVQSANLGSEIEESRSQLCLWEKRLRELTRRQAIER